MVLGGMTVFYLSRNLRKTVEHETDQAVDHVASADGEVVDQQMEKVLVFIEKILDWFINAFKKIGNRSK